MKSVCLTSILLLAVIFCAPFAWGDAVEDMLNSMNAQRSPESVDNPELDSTIATLKERSDIQGLRDLIPAPDSAESLKAALSGDATQDNTETIVKAGAALFELGDHDWLMRNVIHIGEDTRGTGYKVLNAVPGGAVAALVGYLPGADLGFEHAGYALEKVVVYLDDQEALQSNARLFARFTDPAMDEHVRHAAVLGVVAGHLIEAEPSVRSLLASDDVDVRQRAAWALGELGQKSSLAALGSVAVNDPAYELVEKDGFGWKQYFVRDEARQAIQKIEVQG